MDDTGESKQCTRCDGWKLHTGEFGAKKGDAFHTQCKLGIREAARLARQVGWELTCVAMIVQLKDYTEEVKTHVPEYLAPLEGGKKVGERRDRQCAMGGRVGSCG
jgi:hypothetical protein